MKITDKILRLLKKDAFTASEITRKLKLNINIRPRLRELEMQKRIMKLNNKKPYKYIAVLKNNEISFLYKLMNEDMNPNKKISKEKIEKIKQIERMLK